MKRTRTLEWVRPLTCVWQPQPYTTSAVGDLLDVMRRSEVWRQATLCFSDLPGFTKEMLENREREEAEWEAKRETEREIEQK